MQDVYLAAFVTQLGVHVISVVLPVFNAEPFLREAVSSAVSQEEVLEVLLIDDGSSDGSREVCQSLELESDKVKLFQHSGGVNRGPGQTRNLGLKNATSEFVSFLDADDFYLKDRFKKDLPVIQNDKNIDGVYSVVGVRYEDAISERKHMTRMQQKKKNIHERALPIAFTGMECPVEPKKLFLHLLKTDLGWIHLNGLLLRRSSLEGMEYFNNNYLGQDSEFITRISCQRKLVCSGYFEPVAIRRVHSDNRILANFEGTKRDTIGYNYWLDFAEQTKDFKAVAFCLLRMNDGSSKPKKLLELIKWFSRRPRVLLNF